MINPPWLWTLFWSLSGTHFPHTGLNLLFFFNKYLQNLHTFLSSTPHPPQTPLSLPWLRQDGERRWTKHHFHGLSLHHGTGHISINYWIESILSIGKKGSQNNQTGKERSFKTFHSLHTLVPYDIYGLRCP